MWVQLKEFIKGWFFWKKCALCGGPLGNNQVMLTYYVNDIEDVQYMDICPLCMALLNADREKNKKMIKPPKKALH